MCKLSVSKSKNLRWLNKEVKIMLRYDTERFHVFTIYKCHYTADVNIIIYLFNFV